MTKLTAQTMKISIVMLLFTILIFSKTALGMEINYDDIKGHWATPILERAVKDGYLEGSNKKLMPNGKVKGSELVTIMSRILDLQVWDESYAGIPENCWYYRYAAIGKKVGIIPENSFNFDNFITRKQLFIALENVYNFNDENVSEEILEKYKDAGLLDPKSRSSVAFLSYEGILKGDDRGRINPNSPITRSELVKLLYGIKDRAYIPKVFKYDDSTNISGVKIKITANEVGPDGNLRAVAYFSGVKEPFLGTLQWYIDGKKARGYPPEVKNIKNGGTYLILSNNKVTDTSPDKLGVALELSKKSNETAVETKIYTQRIVKINKPKPVIRPITTGYRGPWKKGYSLAEKNEFANTRGYASATEYLVWVSKVTQTVNIFKGRKGYWKIEKVMGCATGAEETPTPSGITYITYKQKDGWNTDKYTVKPVVRFYPNSGYAFHSILYRPGTADILDGTLGRPVSHGCVRLAGSDIWWIFNKVPEKTTVVIY